MKLSISIQKCKRTSRRRRAPGGRRRQYYTIPNEEKNYILFSLRTQKKLVTEVFIHFR